MTSPLERRSIQLRMWVETEDGTRLGKVCRIGERALVVRPRGLRARAHPLHVPLERVVGLGARAVRVRGSPEELRALPPPGPHERDISTEILPLPEPAARH